MFTQQSTLMNRSTSYFLPGYDLTCDMISRGYCSLFLVDSLVRIRVFLYVSRGYTISVSVLILKHVVKYLALRRFLSVIGFYGFFCSFRYFGVPTRGDK